MDHKKRQSDKSYQGKEGPQIRDPSQKYGSDLLKSNKETLPNQEKEHGQPRQQIRRESQSPSASLQYLRPQHPPQGKCHGRCALLNSNNSDKLPPPAKCNKYGLCCLSLMQIT